MFSHYFSVKRIINNNIVVAQDFKGHEVIAIGKGLGFRKKAHDVISKKEVTKMYSLIDECNKKNILSLFEQIPYGIIEVSQEIIDMAEESLKVSFNINLLLVLADHIHFSITQHQAGVVVPVLLNEEIKRLYRDVYQIGRKAIDLIYKNIGIRLQNSEAASIAFHLVSAMENASNQDARRIMQGVSDIINLVEQVLGPLDEDSVAYPRFLMHLKYFMKRILLGQSTSVGIPAHSLLSQLVNDDQRAFTCVDHISDYVLRQYHYSINDEERLFLLVHILRLILEPKENQQK